MRIIDLDKGLRYLNLNGLIFDEEDDIGESDEGQNNIERTARSLADLPGDNPGLSLLMKMASVNFEEQFPSLKGKKLLSHNREDGLFYGKDIQQHCLDKQKVKNLTDYLDKIIEQHLRVNGALTLTRKEMTLIREEIKELGLYVER